MAFRKITEGDMLGKGNVGRPDTPGVSTAEMQRIMDELPREVLAPAFNELAGQLEAETAAADIGAAAPEGVTAAPAGKLQAVLNGLRDLVKAHTDRADNPHGVTAAQAGAYSKAETDAAISAKVVELGAGDMAKSIYDPGNEQQPLLPRNGDGSNVTAAFTEAEQDADIASGEKLSVLFGKIKKRFSAMLAAIADRYTKAEAEARFMPNPNLLDNSDYKIAQAGYNGAHGNTAYLCDRWSKYIVTGRMTGDGMLLTPSGAGAWIIQYKLLTDTGLTEGDTVTLTVKVNGTVYSGSATLQIKSAAVDADSMVDTDDIRAAAFIPAGNTDQIAVYIVIKQTCTLTWTKLEKGSVATPYVPKGYGADLAECQRYYIRLPSESAVCGSQSANYVWYTVSFPEMRIIPTLSVTPGDMKFSDNINLYSVSKWAYSSIRSTQRSLTKIANTSSTVPVNTPLFASNGWFELYADL